MASLESKIQKDKQRMHEKMKDFMWFHGNINRRIAETRLKNNGKGKNGTFLVRESAANAGDFVLSIMKDKKFAHYKITQRRALHSLYSIDNGKVIDGLEELVAFYKSDDSQLPCKLKHPLKRDTPPPLSLKKGYANILHSSIQYEEMDLTKRLLEHSSCPNVNMKDDKGSLVIHLAAEKGWQDVVRTIIEKGAEVSAPNAEGNTALHIACMRDHEEVVRVLLNDGNASVHTRNHENGHMPLHDAARGGHDSCVQLLLSNGACAWPFDNKKECLSPFDLATQFGHQNIAQRLDAYQPPPAKTQLTNWYHPNITRQDAQTLFRKYAWNTGLFLVRPSSRQNVAYVLQLANEKTDISYEVCLLQREALKMYRIAGGPLFSSIEHLVEFYCMCADGLPTRLTTAIKPNGGTMPLLLTRDMEDTYMQSTLAPKVQDDGVTEYMQAANVVNSKTGERLGPGKSNLRYTPSFTQRILRRKFEGHLLDASSIKEEYELGQGEFGSVIKGTWNSPDGEVVDVAIKTLHEEHLGAGRESFLAEAEVMVKLSHPCIVTLIGVSPGPPLMLVQELVELGSLLDFVLDYPEKIDIRRDLFLWCAQVACGMLYLEKQNYVHRDLATRNILLASKTQAKVGDFGLSRCLDNEHSYYKASKGGRWPVRWYAPEAVNYGTFSHSSDVWSFGVTMWEMFTFGDQPYADKTTGAEVVSYIEKGGRLHQPDNCPDNLYDVMNRCWQYDPKQRATFRELLDIFNAECAKIGQHLINPGGTVHVTRC